MSQVTFTATVTPNTLSTAPTGTVTFTVDGDAQAPVDPLHRVALYRHIQDRLSPRRGTHTVFGYLHSGDSTYTQLDQLQRNGDGRGRREQRRPPPRSPPARPSFALGSSVTSDGNRDRNHGGHAHRTGYVHDRRDDDRHGQAGDASATGNTATATLTCQPPQRRSASPPVRIPSRLPMEETPTTQPPSGTTTVTVSNPEHHRSRPPNITISSPSPGNSGTSTITLTSTGGYAGTATVSASVQLRSMRTTDSAARARRRQAVALSSGGTGTTTITITTVAATGNFRKGPAGNFRKTGRPDCSSRRNR